MTDLDFRKFAIYKSTKLIINNNN